MIDQNITELLKSINNDYSAVLSAIFSLLLLIITLIYVMLTYRQVQQLEKSHKISVIPTLVPDIVEAKGTEYFGDEKFRRRQLGVKCKVQNIGDGPALRIYSKIRFKYNYIDFKDYDELFEYSYLGYLASMEENELEMHFETIKIEKMIEDFSIKHAKNMYRVRVNPHHKVFLGPSLVIELVYSNIHGQFFKTVVGREISSLKAYNRNDEEKQHIFWSTEEELKDDEPFELTLMNPIFQSFEITPLENNAAIEFIEKYEKLIPHTT